MASIQLFKKFTVNYCADYQYYPSDRQYNFILGDQPILLMLKIDPVTQSIILDIKWYSPTLFENHQEIEAICVQYIGRQVSEIENELKIVNNLEIPHLQ